MGDLQTMVEGELRKCSVEELRVVAGGINIAADQIGEDKTKAQVMRAITDTLDGLPDDEQRRVTVMRMLPHVPAQVSTSIMGFLSGNTNAATNVTPDTSQNAHLQQTLELLKGMGLTTALTNRFKKDLKISTIDESSKESLNYISLCAEINDGRTKGYDEDEIKMALRKAVAPRSSLRTIFDAKDDMTLESMLSFIRTVLKEKSASDMKEDLEKDRQKGDDTPQSFVLRAMQRREEVIKAAARRLPKRVYEPRELTRPEYILNNPCRVCKDTKAYSSYDGLCTSGAHDSIYECKTMQKCIFCTQRRRSMKKPWVPKYNCCKKCFGRWTLAEVQKVAQGRTVTVKPINMG